MRRDTRREARAEVPGPGGSGREGGRRPRTIATALVAPLGRAASALAFAALASLMRVIVLAHFRRARLYGREHFPRHGPGLVVANHPSTWTDVVVMDVLLGRRMHFLALEELFRSWPGSMLLAVHGALPVCTSADGALRARRNAQLYRRCEALLDRGEVVAMFPEGLSLTDATILPLKPGAARLALSYLARAPHDDAFHVIPVALRYSDRTAFQSDVVLNVGEPVEAGDLAGEPVETAVPRLTSRIAEALRDLVPSVPGWERRALVAVLEGITHDTPLAPGTERMRAMAHALAALERGDPGAHARLARRARAYDRARHALRLTDRALAEHEGGRLAPLRSAATAALIAIALVPALAGAVLHAIPAFVISRFAARYSDDPTRKSFARIGGGLVLFPPWYVALGLLAHAALGMPLHWLPGLWLAFAVLGLLAIRARRWMRIALERGRVAWLGGRAPRLLRRARGLWLELAREAAGLEARGAAMGHSAAGAGAPPRVEPLPDEAHASPLGR